MAHFAQLDENNVVLQVIVVHNNDCKDVDGNESEAVGVAFCQSLFPGTDWKQTSYNGNMRGTYAGIGYTYDTANDVFVPPVLVENNDVLVSAAPMEITVSAEIVDLPISSGTAASV